VTGQIFSVLLSPKSLDIHFKNEKLCCFTVCWLWCQFTVGTFLKVNSYDVMELLIY
jgi:hypothetical protein